MASKGKSGSGAGGKAAAAYKGRGGSTAAEPGAASTQESGLSKAKVIIDDPAVFKTAKQLFGRDVTPAELATLIGAPDNATVGVGEFFGGLNFTMSGRDFNAVRRLGRVNGVLSMTNETFDIHEGAQGKGLGSSIFARQVDQASRMGVKAIRTTAARGTGLNGYYTWARLGYDAALPGNVRAELPPSLRSATKISDLMRTAEGRAAWKHSGVSTYMTFDLTPGSLSRRVLAAYTQERKSR